MKGHVLYGVLNWGLGHASRSKPIISALLESGYQVTLASDGAALEWLQHEFPDLKTLAVPGYKVRYARGKHQLPKLLSQLPRLAWVAHKERKLVARWQRQLQFTGIISDNRLGFVHPAVPSAYLTHQLKVPVKYGAALARWAHQRYYQKFSEVWIPDDPQRTLSGLLSETPPSFSGPVRFTGNLSRFQKAPAQEKTERVAILSGPEPQRSILEERLRDAIRNTPQQRWYLVTGVNTPSPSPHEALTVYGRLSSAELQRLLQKAQVVVSRSGYSSLMDYAALGAKAVLIPTPGQGEQEYLANHHSQVYAQGNQNNLNLEVLGAEAMGKPGLNHAPASRQQLQNLFGLFEGKGKG